MAIALVLVALAMIAGGVAAVVQGVPIMALERGWTLVISGAVVAGSGAVLGGIALSLTALGRIERELRRLREPVGRPDAVPLPASGLTASREGPAASAAAVKVAPAPRRGALTVEPVRAGEIAPEPIPAMRAGPTGMAGDRPAAAADIAAGGPAGLDPSAAAPTPNGPTADASAPDAPTVVGTYDSGGNSYVMFSDGSIAAETPNGPFRFRSLDELKAFIASGGEETESPTPAA